jgi:Protein of unknown function (DUF642)
MKSTALVISVAILLVATGVSAQIINGSFEPSSSIGYYQILNGGSTGIPGWTTVTPGVEWYDPSSYLNMGVAADGSYIVDLASTAAGGGIEQTFTTVPGAEYFITFSLGTQAVFDRLGTCEITVEADGVSQVFSTENHSPVIVWETKIFSFTADDAQATLRFSTTQSDYIYFAHLDDVSSSDPLAADESTWGRIKTRYR